MTTETDLEISDIPDTYNINNLTNMQNNISSETMSKFNQGTDQIIANIKQMQTTEMKLYTDLDNQNLTADQKNEIIDRINQISQTRSTLYNSLNNMAGSYQQNVSTSQNTIQQQMFALDIVENELNEAKIRMKALETDKYNKLRLVEINTYYSKRFNAHKEIVKSIVYVCIFMLIIIILGKKQILPRNIYIVLNGLIIVIGVIVIGKKMIDLSNRDNMNFDEYDWYFDKTKAPSDTSTSTNQSDPWASITTTCVGEMCCTANPGLIYDSVNKVCILNSDTTLQTSATPTETETNTNTDTEPMNNMNQLLRPTAFQKW